MTKPSLEELTGYLRAAGFSPDEDFDITGDGSNSVVVSVIIPLEETQLPDELKRFAWGGYEVERAMYKGNTDKRTWNGANFELALRGFASDRMHKDPETIALEQSLHDIDCMEDLESYEAKRQVIWDRICSDPQIAAWEKDLQEHYH